jgi:hypothetical protein
MTGRIDLAWLEISWLLHTAGFQMRMLDGIVKRAIDIVLSAAALLISLANLLAGDCMLEWFQEDPLTRTGRAAIPEFAAAAFGPNDSIYWRDELAGPPTVPPPDRRALAARATTARDQWRWTSVSGPEFKDSVADIRPGDPPLSLRFAFTWDEAALHFHAAVVDKPAGSKAPAGRRGVELFVNPRNDGLVWDGPDDFQFDFKPDGLGYGQIKLSNARTYDEDCLWSSLGAF